MKSQLAPLSLILLCITILVASFRNDYNKPKDLLTLEQKLDALMSDPITVEKAKQYIRYYKSKVDSNAVRHFWLDTKTLDYFNSLRKTDLKMDGIRIYLADYDESVTDPTSKVVYPKDTRTIVLVATRTDGVVPGGTKLKHTDWFGGSGAALVTPYNYSEPCPPGPGCEPGATLGQ